MDLFKLGKMVGAVHADVREMKKDVGQIPMLESRVAALEQTVKIRRMRERLIWGAVTTLGVASWSLIGLIPWRVWVAVAQALAAQAGP